MPYQACSPAGANARNRHSHPTQPMAVQVLVPESAMALSTVRRGHFSLLGTAPPTYQHPRLSARAGRRMPARADAALVRYRYLCSPTSYKPGREVFGLAPMGPEGRSSFHGLGMARHHQLLLCLRQTRRTTITNLPVPCCAAFFFSTFGLSFFPSTSSFHRPTSSRKAYLDLFALHLLIRALILLLGNCSLFVDL